MYKRLICIVFCILTLILCSHLTVSAAQQDYITLTEDTQWDDLAEQTLWVDLNGKTLTVSGSGTLYAFDSANDNYDASACGKVINNGTVQVIADVLAPNGNRYISLTSENTTTMHRVSLQMTAVTLRTSQAGLYYKAKYECDDTLAAKVKRYGVVVSLVDMPGADFLSEWDENRYTVSEESFVSGVVATSGSVFGIMKTTNTVEVNATNGETVIYANPYICFDMGKDMIIVADNKNPGKTVDSEGFDGVGYSLHDAMDMLDDIYYEYEASDRKTVDSFFDTWKENGMAAWSFTDIKRDCLRDLELDGDNVGYCPVCQKDVTWIGLDPADYTTGSYGTIGKGKHLYLKGSITSSTTTGSAFLNAPGSTGSSACLHLNGYDLTATKNRAIYGSAGVLNVMGTGTVSGYQSSSGAGSTIQINTSGTSGALNLYGGTYTVAEDAHASSYVINIADNGGIINVYKTATVDGTRTDRAIRCGESKLTNSVVRLYGTTVNGRLYLKGPNTAKGFEMRLTIQDSTVNGTVDAGVSSSENFKMTLSGKVSLSKLLLENGLRITLDNLEPGSQIALNAEGIFTKDNSEASDYLSYFTPVSQGYNITVKNNTLRCAMDYVSDLKLDENGQAFCPVCKEVVTWTPISEAPSTAALPADSHSYLTADIDTAKSGAIFTSPASSGKSACLHLNGHDVKNTDKYVIFGSSGILNVMGSGTISGKATDTPIAGAVYTNVTYANMQINLYSGTYQNTNDSHYANGPVISIGNVGGKINIYEDAILNRPGKQAIYVGTLINKGTAILGIYGAEISGNVTIKMPKAYDESTGYGGKTSTTNMENATIHGTVTVESGERTTVNLKDNIAIDNLTINEGTPIVMDALAENADIKVTATGAFAQQHDSAYQFANYFTAADDANWVIVRDKTLTLSERKSLPNGNKVIFFGNSRTFYGKCVIEDPVSVQTQAERTGNQGYFYQLCKANGYDVDVTNFTFGGHRLEDYYSETCTTNSSHHHLGNLVDRDYDYVVMQEGSANRDAENILDTLQPLMDIFLEGNPNTKFVFLVTNNVHYSDYVWRSSIKELEEAGVIVVDWGALVNDLVNGDATVPGGTETYHKFSFTVNATADDGYHPNVLTGYITAQMLFSAITGESAVDQEYAYWNDPRANSSFNMDTYKKGMYAYDNTVPSNTNFEAIFKSPTEMTGLQQLIDLYLEEKGYREYE